MNGFNFRRSKKQLNEEGYLIINDVIPDNEVERYVKKLNDIYKDLFEAGQSVYPAGVGATERLILNLHNKDEMFIELVDHPAVFPLVQYMLQDGSYQNEEPFILSQLTARDPHAGAPPQQLHIDSRFPGPPYALMTIVL